MTEKNIPANESYPPTWYRVELMISPQGTDIHCIGGSGRDGNHDAEYPGFALLNKRLKGADKHLSISFQAACLAIGARKSIWGGYRIASRYMEALFTSIRAAGYDIDKMREKRDAAPE